MENRSREEVSRLIGKLVRNFRMGAWCDTILWECVLEVAGTAAPEHVVEVLPEALRAHLEWFVLNDEDLQQRYPNPGEWPGFTRLHSFFVLQKSRAHPPGC